MKVKLSQAHDMIVQCIKVGLVPIVKGSPAVGKSSIVHQIAKEFDLKVIDLRLAQCDPTDLLGFPNTANGRGRYVPMETFPIEGDEVPKGYDGWLLFMDEFTSAPRGVQAAAYKLVLDRMVGTHHLHKKVAIVCAGNLETDGAIVEEMSTALESRLVHMEVTVDHTDWCEGWAMKNGIDHRITSFVKFKPGMLYTFSPDHTDCTYASPRTWEFANRLVKGKEIGIEDIPLLAGTISEGVAREFRTFTQIYSRLPTLTQMMEQATTLPVPQEPSILFALTGSIAHNANDENAGPLMDFVSRLPIEFQVVTLREMVRRSPALMNHKSVQAWITKNAKELF